MKVDFMKMALLEAKKAFNDDEVPVGAIIVKDNKIIGSGYNLKEKSSDPTCHAEIIAIKNACKTLNSWRLTGCSMYVTLEPCPMCAGAIVQSRLSNLYIGTFDDRSGACGSIINIVQNDNLNHWVNVIWTYNENCSKILEKFFKIKRGVIMDNDKKNLVLDKMTKICTCKSISRHKIKESIKKGNLTVKDISKDTGACTGYCKGKNCGSKIENIIKEYKDDCF